jgi:DNA-binding NarL/FixJ family response regulator
LLRTPSGTSRAIATRSSPIQRLTVAAMQGHVKVIYEKLDVTTKAEAAAFAARLGLI